MLNLWSLLSVLLDLLLELELTALLPAAVHAVVNGVVDGIGLSVILLVGAGGEQAASVASKLERREGWGYEGRGRVGE